MSLILEGPDMVGKTTLMGKLVAWVQEAADEIGGAGYAVVGREKYGLEEAGYTSDQWAGRVRAWTVCDRFALSEMVYGTCSGRGPAISWADYHYVHRAVRLAGGLVVVVSASPERYQRLLREVYPTRGEAFTQRVCGLVNGMYRTTLVRSYADLCVSLGDDGRWAHECDGGALREMCREYARRQSALLEARLKDR